MIGSHGEPGLRERKRAATRHAIERAAISLVNEHGYDHVTVDMICDAAMVSPGTFFNYFGSKEGVILGPQPPPLPEAAVRAFVASSGSSVVADLARMVTEAALEHEPDLEFMAARRAVIMATPALVSSEMARLVELDGLLTGIVLQRFAAQGRNVETTPDLVDEAHMAVILAMSVLRFALGDLAMAHGVSAEAIRASLAHATSLIDRLTTTESDT